MESIPKIDERGVYLPFLSYSVISMSEMNTKIKELYDILCSSPIAKYIKPLDYETYHMTIYNTWCIKEQFFPYQLQNGEPNRTLESMNPIMEPVSLAMQRKLEEYANLDSICVKVLNIEKRISSKALVLNVEVTSSEQNDQLKNFRAWCTENYCKTDAALRYHITLGYEFTKIVDDVTPEYEKLENWIKLNIPTMTVFRPIPVVFTTMDKIFPFEGGFPYVKE